MTGPDGVLGIGEFDPAFEAELAARYQIPRLPGGSGRAEYLAECGAGVRVVVTSGRPGVDAETIEAACDTARAWQTTTIAPLRAVRRTLKTPVPDLETDARLAVREQVKAAELAAERHLLNGLEGLSPAPTETPRPPVDAMADAARLWDRVVPRPALRTLSDLLPT